MEKEAFFSGYCRQIDGARTVCAEAEDGKLIGVDCCYPDCQYAQNCVIGKAIEDFLEDEKQDLR